MSVDSVMTRFNPVVAWLLRSPIHPLASRGLMLLSYTGRRSGKRVTIPVGYQQRGDQVTVLVSEARHKRWWRNFAEPGDVELRIRGRLHRGRARVVDPESDFFARAVEGTLRRVPGLDRVFRVRFDRRTGLTPEQLASLREEIAAVSIELVPEASD